MEKDSRHEDQYFLQDRVSDLPDRMVGNTRLRSLRRRYPRLGAASGLLPQQPGGQQQKSGDAAEGKGFLQRLVNKAARREETPEKSPKKDR